MKVMNHILEVEMSARWPWTYWKLHRARDGYSKHFVWGKLSVIWGQPHLIPILVCSHCSEEIKGVGEDCLDWCEGCQQIEGDTEEITTEEYERRHG